MTQASEQHHKSHAKIGIHGDSAHHVAHAVILKRAKLTTLVLVGLLLLGGALTLFVRVSHSQQLAAVTEENARNYVTVIQAKSNNTQEALTLPATLQGMIEAPIYARSSGYVARWNKDIGATVTKGDVLAVIDTPEIDAQYSQALAVQAQANSAYELAKTTAQRWEDLRKKDAVTEQELTERRSNLTQAKANLDAAIANVQRLKDQQGFKNIVAPFTGVITKRNINVGDLIDAGGNGRVLFNLSQVDTLRVYIYVPQAYAQRIKVGDKVTITQAEQVNAAVQGNVVRIAGAIDPVSRSLQVEINIPNQNHQLLAGAYVQVALRFNGAANVLQVPSNVLLFRPEGTMIAVADDKGKVSLHKVTVGHDLGKTVEILSGINAADKLVLNPSDSIAEGDVLVVQEAKAEKSDHATKSAEKARS